MPPTAGRYRIETPPGRAGAIAVIACLPDDPEAWLRDTGLAPVGVGDARLRELFGLDEGLAIRWTDARIDLTPHGGVAVVRALARALESDGLAESRELAPREAYPEAGSVLEARMLAALAMAPSPRAIDLLLDQPARWAAAEPETLADTALNHLLTPPTVALVGPPNVGKSSLLNALAGRSVSIVADEVGTTRDHVGVGLVVDGLAVRAMDMPGVLEAQAAINKEAQAMARAATASADLVLSLGDSESPPIELPFETHGQVLTVATRTDLGEPGYPHDAAVALAGPGAPVGLEGLGRAVRERLVPDSALVDPRPWRFWRDDP